MFLHPRHLLTIDSLIFETCLITSSFWHPNSPKIHLQTHKAYQLVGDYFFSQLLFDLESFWGSFWELSGASQTKMEVCRQVPLVLRAIFQHQAPHHLSNAPPWSQNKLKIIPKFIPRLFRSEILGQTEPEILWKSIQNRSNIHHTCMSGFNFSFS